MEHLRKCVWVVKNPSSEDWIELHHCGYLALTVTASLAWDGRAGEPGRFWARLVPVSHHDISLRGKHLRSFIDNESLSLLRAGLTGIHHQTQCNFDPLGDAARDNIKSLGCRRKCRPKEAKWEIGSILTAQCLWSSWPWALCIWLHYRPWVRHHYHHCTDKNSKHVEVSQPWAGEFKKWKMNKENLARKTMPSISNPPVNSWVLVFISIILVGPIWKKKYPILLGKVTDFKCEVNLRS